MPSALAAHGLAPGLTAKDYAERLDYELGVIERMKYPGYFLIVADFIQWAKAQGIPVGPGPRLRRRLGRRLVADHHRPRSAPLRPDLRALPQSRPRVDARLRHRLLPEPARRGHPLRPGEIRRRPGGADHHLRHAAGARRAPRRRPRAADALRPGRPAGQDGAAESGEPGDAGRRPSPTSRDCRRRATKTTAGRPPARRSPRSSRASTATPRPTPPASSSATGRSIELVPLYRDPRSGMKVTQFNMKWVEQAGLVKFDFLGLKTLTVLDLAVAARRQARHRRSTCRASRSTTPRPTSCWRAARPSASSRWKAPACAAPSSTCSPTASRT